MVITFPVRLRPDKQMIPANSAGSGEMIKARDLAFETAERKRSGLMESRKLKNPEFKTAHVVQFVLSRVRMSATSDAN